MNVHGVNARTVNARTAVKRLALFSDRFAPPPSGITVLIYHRVGGGTDSAVDLEAEVFDRHLAHLVEHHRVVSLDAALTELCGPDPALPGVVVTFDDGTADFTDVAVPILVSHGVPATLYVATEFVEQSSPFPWDAPPTTWTALAEAVSTGVVNIGSHTHSHRVLREASRDETIDEIDRSVELIADRLGVVAHDFAYPKAIPPGPAAEVVVRQRFRSAALAGGRVNRVGRVDPLRLARTPVLRSDSHTDFAARAAGGMRLEGVVRAAAAGVRYRGVTT